MSNLFITFLFVTWGIGALIAGVYDAIDSPSTSNFSNLVQFNVLSERDIGFAGVTAFTISLPNPQWFGSILGLIVWDSSLWGGWANYIRILVPLAFSFGFIAPIIISLIPGRRA